MGNLDLCAPTECDLEFDAFALKLIRGKLFSFSVRIQR